MRAAAKSIGVWRGITAVLVVTLGLSACGDSNSSGPPYTVDIDPANFAAVIDNPYFPLTPGSSFHYTNTSGDGDELITVEVTHDTRVVMGVTCVVVHDSSTLGGQPYEDTYDWFAQDRDGNVWYFGEDTTSFAGGQSSKHGSWEAGVDGALPGIIMMAQPQVGDPYRQEYRPGVAEDMNQVIAVGESVTVTGGSFDNCIRVKDYSPLEPGLVENKLYCSGIGLVLTDVVQGDMEHEELTAIFGPATP